jgi:N6-L-threonylcarbamoyladenine synthase
MKRGKLVIGIESSCDETSIGILKPPRTVLANIISSSLEKHQPFGGVVPEIACRFHLENIDIVFQEALKSSGASVQDIGLVAATHAPGLIGALLVGVSFAKTLSFSLRVPFVGVNHLEAHLEANRIEFPDFQAPYLGLLISGGHTSLVKVPREGRYELLGGTVDDAIGEAFDKTAKLMGLGYPGGPIIDRLAQSGDPDRIPFPVAVLPGTFNFSFSGIKTAVLNYLNRHPDFEKDKNDIAAGFQKSVVEITVKKTIQAAREFKLKRIGVGGGVSANSYLRKRLKEEGESVGCQVYFPSLQYTLDNGAMIAMAGFLKYSRGKTSDLKLPALASVGW